jgi:hypothetical protein
MGKGLFIGIAIAVMAASVIIFRMSNTVHASMALANSGLTLEYSFYRGVFSLQQSIRIVDAYSHEIMATMPEDVWKTGAANAIVYKHFNQPVYFVQMLQGFYEIQLEPPKLTNICILSAEVPVSYVGTFEVQRHRDSRLSISFRLPLEAVFQSPTSGTKPNAHDGNNRCG